MEKLKMHSVDLTQKNISRILEIFPNCASEIRDETGALKLVVNFDQLRQELSADIVEGPRERFEINWPGKRQALLTANSAIAKTLRPSRNESVEFDTTRNLFVEGDNLDSLKLFQETYLGKVKLIYIDPPYNTGGDLIYDDVFASNAVEFLRISNQQDDFGNRLQSNTEANGRFHSDWLSMMYPRLKLAKNLLKDDGVIAISIDDHEFCRLVQIMNEIFGETNGLAVFVWKRRTGAMDSINNVSTDHEYVVCFSRSPMVFNGEKRTFEKYENPDNDPRGPWIADNLSAAKPGGDTHYPIVDPATGFSFLPPKGRFWPYGRKTMAEKIAEGKIIFPKKEGGTPLLKRFQGEAKSLVQPISSWIKPNSESEKGSSDAWVLSSGHTSEGTKIVKDLFGEKVFVYAKPLSLITQLLEQTLPLDGEDIVMDFFAGSGTTGHAVMSYNRAHGTKHRFILVQMPEILNQENVSQKAAAEYCSQLGVASNIAELTKERLRRVAKKMASEREGEIDIERIDTGFRVLKTDSSNMAEVYYAPDGLSQNGLFASIDSTRGDRTDEDFLFQVLLDWGVDLASAIRKEVIQGMTIFFVDENALVACFGNGVTENLVKELAKFKPLRAVFRDNGFASDAVKINVEQIFKQLSPSTEVRSI